CARVCKHMCTCAFALAYVCVHVCWHADVCQCVCACVFVYVCAWLCASALARVHVPAHLCCLHARGSACTWVWYVCVCTCASVCGCVCMHLCRHACLLLSLHVCTWMCECVRTDVPVHASARVCVHTCVVNVFLHVGACLCTAPCVHTLMCVCVCRYVSACVSVQAFGYRCGGRAACTHVCARGCVFVHQCACELCVCSCAHPCSRLYACAQVRARAHGSLCVPVLVSFGAAVRHGCPGCSGLMQLKGLCQGSSWDKREPSVIRCSSVDLEHEALAALGADVGPLPRPVALLGRGRLHLPRVPLAGGGLPHAGGRQAPRRRLGAALRLAAQPGLVVGEGRRLGPPREHGARLQRVRVVLLLLLLRLDHDPVLCRGKPEFG
uniref:Uncharacterized protein n=1 Tax=Anser brachyrhynchus TaxID=132585 RepID=A0A8B9I3A2_9AVES